MAKLHKLLPELSTRLIILRNIGDHKQLHSLAKQASMVINSNCCSFRYNQIQMKKLKCWKCGVEKSSLTDMFCPKCNFIQEPHETKNYFKVLGIEESFDVDQKTLSNKYRRLQNVIHPDKFSGKSTEEKNISQEYSSLINKAYNTLQTPLNRALHLLRLRGERIDEDQKIADPVFLMEIMELNEEVENAETPEKLKALNERNKKTLDEIGRAISDCFKRGDVEKAKEYVIKMKYYSSVAHYIDGILRQKGIYD